MNDLYAPESKLQTLNFQVELSSKQSKLAFT